jgi:hypothetical protein
MASRGFDGRLPHLGGATPTARDWFVTALPAVAAVAACGLALVLR